MEIEKRLAEMSGRAAVTYKTQYTHFLDPAEILIAQKAAHQAGIKCSVWGGWDGAERQMCALSIDEPEKTFPLTVLELRWNSRFGILAHRDLLGAVMRIGLERDAIGDISMGMENGIAYLACEKQIAGYIEDSLNKAGRCAINVREAAQVTIAQPEGSEMRVTVANLRLDALIAAGWKLSRADAQRRIRQGLVKRNHMPEERCDRSVDAGDLLSVRGLGRMRIDVIEGETRRGRLGVRAFRFGK